MDQRRARLAENQLRQVGNLEQIRGQQDTETGSLSLFEFLAIMTDKDTIVQHLENSQFRRRLRAKR